LWHGDFGMKRTHMVKEFTVHLVSQVVGELFDVGTIGQTSPNKGMIRGGSIETKLPNSCHFCNFLCQLVPFFFEFLLHLVVYILDGAAALLPRTCGSCCAASTLSIFCPATQLVGEWVATLICRFAI